jgi:NhaP-type Na+/H+ and K+/H+ antiporter
MNHTFQQLCALGIALLAFGLAELLLGNGFIAAFCAGLMIGNVSRSICACLYEFGEAEGQLLALLIFMIFGAFLVPPALQRVDWRILAYAGLSLTVVRMLPVAVSLIGTGLKRDTVTFLGWFGPRGIASILFGLLVMEETQLPGSMVVFPALTITVLLSVYAHGLTAYPAAKAYGRRVGLEGAPADRPELIEVKEMPLRHPRQPG